MTLLAIERKREFSDEHYIGFSCYRADLDKILSDGTFVAELLAKADEAFVELASEEHYTDEAGQWIDLEISDDLEVEEWEVEGDESGVICLVTRPARISVKHEYLDAKAPGDAIVRIEETRDGLLVESMFRVSG